MLFDTSWLTPGQIFPPKSEAVRLADYADNELLFDGDSFKVYKKWYKSEERRLERVIGEARGIISYAIEVNYHRLTTVGIADLICGEPPSFKAEDGTHAEEAVKGALEATKLLHKLHSIFIDVSRYGDAVVRLYRDPVTGRAALVQYNPGSVFKVVDRECPDRVLKYVLATVQESASSRPDKPDYELLVQIHDRGSYEKQVWQVEGCKPETVTEARTGRVVSGVSFYRLIGLKSAETVKTGLKGHAVFTLHQLMTTGRVWGHDDYATLDPVLAEIWARFGHIASILDKHAEPDVYAPMSAFAPDENGVWRLRSGGNTYIVEPGEQIPGVITWDGQLTAAFMEIDKLFEQLYKLSEMGAVYEACLTGAAISTETAKMHFVKPLGKARRVVNGVADTMLEILCAAAELNGDHLEPTDITASWYDGLPNDEKQEIEKASLKIQADLSTPERENMERFGIDAATAEQIAEEVEERSTRKAASMFGGACLISGADNGDDDGAEES